MAIKKELIDELIASSEGSLIGPNGLVKELTKALVERMLAGELNHHLGYEKHDIAGYNSGNSRNGKSRKKLKGDAGEMEIEVPRDRNGTFEPQLIEKHQTRFTGFDDKILSMYALGMTTRDIQGHLQDLYGVDVSAALISEVTDSVLEEVKAWQDRPLEALYPIVYLDALMVKMRQDGKVENRAVYTAIGINMEGQKSVLGLWANGSEGAKYWMGVLQNLKNRGMKDAFVICTDGLKGFPEAIEAVFPSTLAQTCIVHLAAGDSAFRFSGRDPQDHLYDECGGVAAHDVAQGDQESRFVSDPGGRLQAAVLSAAEGVEKVQTVQGWREALRQFAIRWPERMEQGRA